MRNLVFIAGIGLAIAGLFVLAMGNPIVGAFVYITTICFIPKVIDMIIVKAILGIVMLVGIVVLIALSIEAIRK